MKKISTQIGLYAFMLIVTFFTGNFSVSAQSTNAYTAQGLSSPTVTSDKDDYAPGEVAHITGSGWTLDQGVHVEFKETPDYPDYHIYDLNVDTWGNWKIDYQVEDRHLGVKFTVTAVGKQSAITATTVFTDANVTFSATGLPPGTIINVAYRIDATSGQQSSTENFTPPATPTAVVVPKDHFINYTFPDVTTTGGVTYRATTINTPSSPPAQNGPTNSYTLPNNGGNTITGVYVVSCTAPSITTQPGNQAITYGANTSFTAVASGNTPTYQWEYRTSSNVTTWSPISGANSASYTVSNPTVSMNGYQYHVLVSSCNTSVTSSAATLTVNARPIEITAAAKNKTYGDADPALTYAISSGSLVGADAFTGTLARVTGENIGSYAINQGSVALSTNYSLTYKGANLTIGTKAIEITAAGKNKTYGDADPALTYAISSGSLVGTDAFTGSLARVTGENVGTYAINQGSVALSSNYALAYKGANLTIGTRAIEVTAAAKNKTYGDADPALTYAISSGSLVGADAFTGTLARVTGENIGSYAINQGSVALSSNYALTYKGANLIIGTRAIEITAAAKSKTYGDADPALTYAISSGTLVTGDAFTGTLARAEGENVGTYAINQGNVALSTNYALTYKGANLTIGTRAIEITAAAKNKTYGEADPALTYSISSGSLVGTDAFTGTLTRDAGENIGSFAINQGSVALSGNYALTYKGANLTIGTRAIEITAASKSKTYGEADPALTYSISSGSLVGTDAFTGTLTRDAGENVGSFAINQGSVALSGNYALTYKSADLTIGTRSIEITAAAKSKTYGEADPALTYSISSGSLVGTDAFTGTLTRDAGENVGSFAINQGSVALSSNYALTYKGDNLTIGTRAIEITAAAKSKTYGDTDPELTYGITKGSLAYSDAFTGALTRVTGENVGSFAINQGSVALSGNYALTYKGNNLTVGTRSIEITAAPKSKTYGDTDPELTYGITKGSLAYSDAFTGALTRVTGENVGSFAINQGSVALSGNYALTYKGDNLTIGTRSIEITAAPKSKTYGDTDPELTYDITKGSLAYFDAFTGALTRVTGENVGSFAINQGSVALSGNYALTYKGDNLTIGTRAIEITAAPKSKTYGDTDPELTYDITKGSLAYSDAFTGALTRVTGENVGSFAINQGSVALSGNYALTYKGANLTIGSRAIEITAAAKNKTYGEADPALTYSISSGSLVGTDAFTGTLTRDAGENVGSFAINQGSVALSGNYALTYKGANLTIGTRAIEITAASKSKTYGEADPALTYSISSGSLVGTDAFTGTLTRDAGENVGSFAINQGSVALSGNYALTYKGANLTIGTRAIEITAAAKSKTYGDTDPELTYDITKGSLAYSDAFTGTLTRDAGENVGLFAINQGSVALSGNYALTYKGANLTIGTRAIEITAAPKSKTYGDTDPELTYDITKGSLAYSDAFTGALTRVTGENVGSFAINQGSVALSGNYALTYKGNNLTIGTRSIEITAAAKNKTYGEADPALTYSISSGSLVGTDAFTGTLTRDAGENVGSFAINQGSVALSGNYALTYKGANLTIGSRAIEITAAAKNKTYGEADPALTYSISSGSLVGTDAFTGTLTRVTGEDVAAYAIKQGNVALNSNYVLSYVGDKLTIGTRAIEITAAPKNKTYGEADPELTYSITNGSLAYSDAFTGALTRDAGENVGSFAINQGSVALSSNYALTYKGANLTIGTRAIEITAAAKSKTYGEADPALTYSITKGSLAYSDAFTGTLTRDAGENVGSFAINQGSVALSGNYALTYKSADLTIGTRSIEITAAAKIKTYGEADPALTYSITKGSLAYSDAFTGALTRDAGENVGSFAINQGSVALSGNYALTYKSADLTIGTRSIEITAAAKSKTYGDTDPELTYSITNGSLAYSDKFTGTLTRDAGEDVAAYAIKQGNVALNSNYVLSYVGDKLTIGTRAIEITAAAKNKTYGDTDPELTYGITKGSLAYSDAFTGALTRVTGENVGSFAINQGSVALSGNYALTYKGDNLTIGTRSIEITAAAKSKTYGDTDPELTYDITKGSLAYFDAFTGALTRVTGENVGSFAINQGSVALSGNYALTYKGDNLTIGTRSIEITAAPKSKTYGDTDPELTYDITKGSLAYSDAFTGALTRVTGENVGSFAINQGSVALSGNYALTYKGDNLTIGTRAIEITAAAKSKTYGEADPELTYSITNGSLAYSDKFTGALTRDAGEDVAAYAIKQGNVTLNSNYVLSYVSDKLTIGTRAIEITAAPKSKTYGDADPELTYSITKGSLAFKDAFTGALTRVTGENVGSFAINQGSVALSGNYALTYKGADLTIGTRAIEITAAPKNKTYGEADPELTYSITKGSLAFKDAFTGSLTRDAGENVGSFAINQSTVALNSNYVLSYVGDKLTIGTRAIEITAAPKNKAYGEADPELAYSITKGSLAYSDKFTGTLTRDAGEDVGQYEINQSTVALNSNYVLTYIGDKLTIGTRAIEITAAPKNKTYGEADPELTYSITKGSLAFKDAFTGSLTRDAGENVGSFAINQSTVALNSNYVLSYVGDKLTIGTRAIEITAAPKNKAYGEADPELTYSITKGFLAFKDAFTGTLTRDAGENVGSFAINQSSVALNSNYVLSYVSDKLTIGTRAIEITAAPKSKTYGDTDPALTYSITKGSLAYSDKFTGALTRDAGEDVAAYAIKQGNVALNSNYVLSYVSDKLTIGTRAIEITAAPKNKTYGEADPALTYSITKGSLAYSDKFTGALTRDAGEDVAAYAIKQGNVALNSNYVLSYVSDKLTIGTRSIEITAAPKNKTYGDTDPKLTYSITKGSLAYTDAFTGTLTRLTGENVGAYAINQGSVALNSNYVLTYKGGNLAIAARPITITANAQSKLCGQVDPELTYAITSGNLAFNDAFKGSLLRSAGESTGLSYAINLGTVTLNTNYNLTYVPANLTINGVNIDANANVNPQPVKTTATIVTIKVTSTTTAAPKAVAVTLYVDDKLLDTRTTDANGIATFNLGVLAADVYRLRAVAGSGCTETTVYMPIYDATGGFITGGGWINSPIYPDLQYMKVGGKANFGFVSKYEPGKSIPTGNTEFQFKEGGMNFSSTSYDWLVVSGKKGQYKGTGTINGTGSYGFILTAIDGDLSPTASADLFRIKIYDKATNKVVYDNQYGTAADDADPTTAIGGGSIVIHTTNGNNSTKQDQSLVTQANTALTNLVLPVLSNELTATAYPNPSVSQFNIKLNSSNTTDAIIVRVMDLTGRLVEIKNNLAAGQTIQIGQAYNSGVYFVEVIQGNNRRQLKLVKNK